MNKVFDIGKFDLDITLRDAALDPNCRPTKRMLANASIGVEPFDAYYSARELYETLQGVFQGLPDPFTAIRYHSLAIERDSKPEVLEVTAWTDDGEIMGVRHKTLPVEGVQFHPESILTEHGHALLKNFLEHASTGVPA